MDIDFAKRIIEEIATECGYEVSTPRTGVMLVGLDRSVHSEDNYIAEYTYDGEQWLKVSVDSAGEDSAAIYSLRSICDVVGYAQTLITKHSIRAKRQRD